MPQDEVISRMGRNVRYLREKHGMAKAELARKLEISPQGVSRLELGIASSRIVNGEILYRLCEIFAVSADSLLFDDWKQESK